MLKSASFSARREHRYSLIRIWNPNGGKILPWIGLNPSKADENENDRTIRRCISFSQKNGYDGLVMLNLFSLVSTKPKAAIANPEHNSPENDFHLKIHLWQNTKAVICWGNSVKNLKGKDLKVLKLIKKPLCLGINKDSTPKHPLYINRNIKFKPYLF